MKLLKLIGWKDYNNRWDKREITIDVVVITIAVIVTTTAISYTGLDAEVKSSMPPFKYVDKDKR